MALLDEVAAKIGALSPEDRQTLVQQVAPLKEKMRFIPNEGRQTEAYLSKADVLLYGGQAGGGKTFLTVGLASQEHQSAIIFRRESAQTDGLEKAGKEIIGDTARYNGTDKEWTWPNGRTLKLAGLQLPGDWAKHAGRERDFIAFDEAGEFLREQVSSLIGWLRGPTGQRCRVVLPSNPPRSSDGYWLTEWFAPWLDLHHVDRAAPGELRWAYLVDGSPVWVGGPEPVTVDGETYLPLSFTFIPAALEDNPFRNTPEYRAKLNSLPEPLRSQLLYGDFTAGAEDSQDQAIPTDWVKEAQHRWRPQAPVGIPMCAIGVDVAQGGTDQTVLAIRHDGWFAPLQAIPGEDTPSGAEVAGKVLARRHNDAKVIIDLGGGWGGDALRHLVGQIGPEAVVGYMGVKASSRRTRDQQLRFKNIRTEAYWRLREALDPYQLGGSSIQLPDDRELLADLTAPTFITKSEKGGMAIELEAKDKLVKRLGRSPDKGDAVVMAWFAGAKAVTDLQEWRKGNIGGATGRAPQVVMGRAAARRAGVVR
jgi:hypothetical protein